EVGGGGSAPLAGPGGGCMRPTAELRALGAFYGTPVDDLLARHGAALDAYAEWVLGRDGFAVVTLGNASAIADLGGEPARGRLLRAAARSPAQRWSPPATTSRRSTCARYVLSRRAWRGSSMKSGPQSRASRRHARCTASAFKASSSRRTCSRPRASYPGASTERGCTPSTR